VLFHESPAGRKACDQKSAGNPMVITGSWMSPGPIWGRLTKREIKYDKQPPATLVECQCRLNCHFLGISPLIRYPNPWNCYLFFHSQFFIILNVSARMGARRFRPRRRSRRAKAVGQHFCNSSLSYFISPFVKRPLTEVPQLGLIRSNRGFLPIPAKRYSLTLSRQGSLVIHGDFS
jgi:hypothetical protein